MDVFKINRTKMLDEATLGHKRQGIMTLLLSFYIVYFIAQVISRVILMIPTTVWMLTYDGFLEAVNQYRDSILAGKEDMTLLTSMVNEMAENTPVWLLIVSLVSFVSLVACAIFYCKRYEKRSVASMGIRKKQCVKEVFLGMLAGLVLIGLTVLFAVLSGSVSIKRESNFDLMIIIFFFAFLIYAFSEVLFFFGYFMTSIARDYKISIAIAFGAILFSLLHISGEEISYILLLNTFLFGTILGIYVFKRGDIWGACGILAMWNFVGGCVFGTQSSTLSKIPSIFILEQNENMTLANGGVNGIEGGICTTVILLIAFGLIFLLKTKKGEESLSDATVFENSID